MLGENFVYSAPAFTRLALRTWAGSVLALATAGLFLCLGAANIATRASWHEVEDGVLWVSRGDGVTAADVAPGTPAARQGIQAGDLLIAIDNQPIETPASVVDFLHRSADRPQLTYTLARLGERRVIRVPLSPIPQGNRPLYYVLASIGLFTLLVGTAVRLRRPRDQATLHFFWLCLAFFGMLAFSFNGRLDRLDWFFYWADAVSILVLPPLFLHFTLVFPERTRVQASGGVTRALLPLLYVPGLAFGAARIIAFAQARLNTQVFARVVDTLDRVEPLYLSVCLLGGLMILVRALGRVRAGTARRQLRWILWGTTLGAGPFAFAYALPFATGVNPSLAMELTAIPLSLVPLAFASAIVRYRLMDVEVIVKRGLVWTAAVSAILAMYAVLLRLAGRLFLTDSHQYNSIIAMLATLVVVLLARPVKNAIQNALDRAFYRDRYDYRRALVGFARDLNSDLDLHRLSERLIARVTETLLVDRMALMLADDAGHFVAIRATGFEARVPRLNRPSIVGRRLDAGEAVALDDPQSLGRFAALEVELWRECGVEYFVPCVAKEGTIAVLALGGKSSGELLSSEDVTLLEAVAGQVATAIENGRLYRQLRLKAEELERLREFNENIVESLDDGLVVMDPEDTIVRWNRAMEQLYGLIRAEAVGRRLDDLFDVSVVESLRAARRDAPHGSTLFRVPITARAARAGRKLLVNVASVPLQTAAGSLLSTTGTMLIVEDITSRVRLEEQLQISDKMASIGLLAAGVAHEVNTPLTGISSFTQMLLEQADPDDPRTKVLEKIERQTFRAAKIVNGLLNLSRSSGPAGSEPAPVDLHAVINDVLALLEHQLEVAKIRVRRELSSPALVVNGIEHQLQQVFLNLFLNARDAMPKGGWLAVATHLDGSQAVVNVSDTGSGIPSEHLSRIYDPFFTTKSIGKGTGLGLAITYGIVREHEGTLNCESVLGEGTRFTLMLPISADASAATRAVQ